MVWNRVSMKRKPFLGNYGDVVVCALGHAPEPNVIVFDEREHAPDPLGADLGQLLVEISGPSGCA
jgi:hypothetical protein